MRYSWQPCPKCFHKVFFFFNLTDVHFYLSFVVYTPSDPVPIVAGVLTTAVGLAILLYICIYRTAAEEVQPNEFTQTSTENPNASYSSKELEVKEM